MLDVPVTHEVSAYARDVVGAGRFGRRGYADASVEQQVVGLIGQTVVQDLLEMPRPRDEGRSDGGVDFRYRDMAVDMKTMGRTGPPKPHYVNNFMAVQQHLPTDLVIFTSLNKRTRVLTVCGWINEGGATGESPLLPERE